MSWTIQAFWLVLAYDLLEDRHIDDVTEKNTLFKTNTLHSGNTVIDHRISFQPILDL